MAVDVVVVVVVDDGPAKRVLGFATFYCFPPRPADCVAVRHKRGKSTKSRPRLRRQQRRGMAASGRGSGDKPRRRKRDTPAPICRRKRGRRREKARPRRKNGADKWGRGERRSRSLRWTATESENCGAASPRRSSKPAGDRGRRRTRTTKGPAEAGNDVDEPA